jgi:excisionase family DNA binding protein
MKMDDVNPNTASKPGSSQPNASPWLTVEDAAQRARCGVKTIYREVHAKRLRAARIGGRRELRLLPEWIDQWLVDTTTPGRI